MPFWSWGVPASSVLTGRKQTTALGALLVIGLGGAGLAFAQTAEETPSTAETPAATSPAPDAATPDAADPADPDCPEKGGDGGGGGGGFGRGRGLRQAPAPASPVPAPTTEPSTGGDDV
jgi:hypothetical protein